MIPFIGHHLFLPWSLKIHVFHVNSALSSTHQPRTLATPVSPAAVSLATRVQPRSSPNHGETQGSPAAVSAPSLLLKTKRPLQRLSLMQNCQRSCRHSVFVQHLSSGHLKAEMLLQHGSYPVERNVVVIIPIVPVGNPEREKSKDYPGGSFKELLMRSSQ